jgi:hypothetical protein
MLAKVLVAKMPVNASVHQPMGLLRRTSVALESVGSAASSFLLMQNRSTWN